MKETTLMKIAKDNGYNISAKKYRYWNNALFFNNTAICFDIIKEDGFETICDMSESFPKFVTKEYIQSAVESNAESLGIINLKNKNKFGSKIYFKFDEEMY